MIRLMGAVLLAAGCGYLGVQAAENLRRRSRSLSEMARALALVEGELELGSPPLGQLLERVAGRCSGPAKALLEACAQGLDRLDQEDFSALWRRKVAQLEELGEEGRAALAPLGDILGRYDGQAQREGTQAVRRTLEMLARRWEEERRRQGRVYQVLGLSGGAFLAILLL